MSLFKSISRQTGGQAGAEKLPLRGLMLAIAGACLFSTKSVIIKIAYTYNLDAETLMVMRMGIALPVYLVFAWMALQDRRRKDMPFDFSDHVVVKTAALGVLSYYCATWLDLKGLTYITAQFERLILFAYPTLVILIGAVFLKTPVGLKTVLAVAITYLGLAVILGKDLQAYGDDVLTGSAFVMASALVFAIYLVLAPGQMKKIGSRMFTCLSMIGASIAITVHFLATHDLSALAVQSGAWFWAAMLAIVATVIPSFLLNAAIEEIGPGPASTLSGFGPVCTAFLGVWLLDERFTSFHLVGMVLVIIGALILSQEKHRKV